eukprot:429557_1
MGNLSTSQTIEIDNQFKLQRPFTDLPGLIGPDSKGFYYHQQDETKIHSNSQNSIKIKFKYTAIDHNKYDSFRNYRYKWVYQVNDKLTGAWHDIHKSLYYNEEEKMDTVTLPQKYEIIRAYLSKKDPIPPYYLHRSKMVEEMFKSVSRSSLYNEQNLKCVIATKKIKTTNKERTSHPSLLIWDRRKGFGKYDDTGAMMIYLSKTKGGQKKYKIQMKCEPTTPYDLKRYKWKYSQTHQENLNLEHGLIDIVHWCLKYEIDNNYQHMRNCIQFMADLCDTFKIKYDSTHWANSVRIIKKIKNDSKYCSSDTNIMKELTEIIDEQVAKMSFDTQASFTEFKQYKTDKYVTYPSINGGSEVDKLLETNPEKNINNTQTENVKNNDEKHAKEEQKHWTNEFNEDEMKEEYKQKLVPPIRSHCVECIMNRDLVNQQCQLLDTFQDLLDSKQICYDNIGLNNANISCYDAPQLAIQKKEIQIPRKLTDKVIPNKVNGWNNKLKYIGKKKIGPSHLFNYMHKSMLVNGSYVGNEKIKIINFDFYDKDTGKCLYCIMEIQGPNAKNYKWKLHNKLYNAFECKTFMNILPISPRNNKIFQIQLQQVLNALRQWNVSKKFNKIKWNKVNSYYRQAGDERTTLSLKNEKFKRYFSVFVRNRHDECDDINIFPILMFNNSNKYWIEYVFIVEIKGSNIGISFGYNAKKGIIEVTGIHLDKNSLYVQHKLALPNHKCHCLDNFISNYSDIKIGEFNEEKDKIKQLKTQLKQYKLMYKELYDQQQTNSVSSTSLLMSNVNVPHLYPQTVNTTYDLQVPLYPSISNYGLNNNYNIPLSYSNSITTSVSQYALNGYYNGQIDPSVTNTIINNVVGPRSYSASNNQLVENQSYK